MMDRAAKSRLGGAALAVAVLALVWATPGVARADDAPSATFHVTSTVATVTNEDGEPITITKIVTVVNLDFGDALLTSGIDPSSITVTVDGVALDYTKHGFTFNHQRLSVTIEEWRLGTVTEAELQQRRVGDVRVSYVQPADPGDERLRYATGSDVGSFEVTAMLTTEEEADASFVAPAEPKTVTATVRANGSPQTSRNIILQPAEARDKPVEARGEPGKARDAGTSAPTGQKVEDIVRRICKELGGSCS